MPNRVAGLCRSWVMRYQAPKVTAVVCSLLAANSAGCSSVAESKSTFGPGGAVTVHYHEGWSGRPAIQGSINGVRSGFLIGTGANEPVLTNLDLSEFFGKRTGCFVIYDEGSDRYFRYNPKGCAERFSPCSKFKIANSLTRIMGERDASGRLARKITETILDRLEI